jgi:S-(hydroxymethyl)glutathione dehydrogenase / alcohol dehydrogenase
VRARLLERPGAPLAEAELQLPEPQDDQVRVKLLASGVCHSDLHAADGDWTVPLPLILGHEGAGVVEAVGPRVADVRPGDHVVLSWYAPCRRCAQCAAGRAWLCTGTHALEHPAIGGVHAYLGLGTFAEQALVPESAAIPIDASVPPAVAALIGCAVATGVGAVVNTAKVKPGESAIVIGCGGVGQAIVLGLQLAGAHPIVAVDTSPTRREQARALGATAQDHAEGTYDHAFEAIGLPQTIEQLPALLDRGGQAILVGMPKEGVTVRLDPFDLADQGKRLLGCNYGSTVPSVDFPRLARLYTAGLLPLDRLIGARRDLDGADRALQDLRDAAGLRTVLEYA